MLKFNLFLQVVDAIWKKSVAAIGYLRRLPHLHAVFSLHCHEQGNKYQQVNDGNGPQVGS